MIATMRGKLKSVTAVHVLVTLIVITAVSILTSERSMNILGPTASKDNTRKDCLPCDSRPGGSIGPRMVFIRNSTQDLLDPRNGPLAFGSSQHRHPTGNNASCPACPQPDIIMTFVDDGYLDTLSIWLHYYKQLDHSRRILCLFALSETAFQKVKRLILDNQNNFEEDFGRIVVVQATSLPTKYYNGNSRIWAYRMRTLSQFLHSFPLLNFLFTDLDAVWLQDPQSLFAPLPPPDLINETTATTTASTATTSIDIVASQATFPKGCSLLKQSKARNQLLETIGIDGGTAVFGFIYFHNSPSTRRIAADLARKASTDKEFDDQRALNCKLYNTYNLTSSTPLTDGSFLLDYILPISSSNISNNNATTNENTTSSSITTTLRIRLLSGSQVVRDCARYETILHENAIVAHCLSRKNGQSKLKAFQDRGLLPTNLTMYDWEATRTSSTRPSSTQLATGEASDQNTTMYFNDSQTASFALVVRRFQARRSSSTSTKTTKNLWDLLSAYNRDPGPQTQVLNSVRVPKAGSSSLSIVARALAGCLPDGFPACNFPGDPPGSCPRQGLMCPRVKGQVSHFPNYDENGRLPLISSLRDPSARLLSAFFYTKPHRPEPIDDHRWETFVQYVRMPQYRNVMTKMFTGSFAYKNFDKNKHTVKEAKERLCKMNWFYIIGMETSSKLLLYETAPFDKLEPNPVVFDLPAAVDDASYTEGNRRLGFRRELEAQNDASLNYNISSDSVGKRQNHDSDYDYFRNDIFVENNGDTLIRRYNEEDFEVYEFARKLLCARLGRSGILEAVATAEDDTFGSFHLLKESVEKEVESFCPNAATMKEVELYCPTNLKG